MELKARHICLAFLYMAGSAFSSGAESCASLMRPGKLLEIVTAFEVELKNCGTEIRASFMGQGQLWEAVTAFSSGAESRASLIGPGC